MFVSMDAEERMKKEDNEVLLEKENPNNIDLERCSVSSSSMNGCDSKWEANGMVKIEIDAARALADFAQLALLESENPSRKWGNKRRRSKKRLKNDTTLLGDWGSNLESSKLKSVDLVQRDQSTEALPWDKKLSENVANTIKAEHDSELPTTTPMCPTIFVPSNGGKSKQQHLTEAEKEARRLRRVLANRESARQTIRRRQAMHEELAKQATHLALDNESMKQEKELAMKEYQSLKDKNKHLKSEMAKNIKDEAEEIAKEIPSTMAKGPASSEKLPLLGYTGPPFTPIPFIWPPIIQPFNLVQTQAIVQNATTSQDSAAPKDISNPSQEQGNPLSTNGPRAPFYIVPCPWFFPLTDHRNQLHPHPLDTGGLRIKQDDGSLSCQNVTVQSSKSTENGFCSTEAHSSNDLPKTSIELPTSKGGCLLGTHPDGVVLTPSPIRSVKPETVGKSEDCVQQDSTTKTESFFSSGGGVQENKPEPDADACRKHVDAAAAAEARKRRKELTKLKSHHNRQPRLRC